MKQIPLVNLKAQYDDIREEINQAIGEVLDSCDFIGGKVVKGFEEQFAKYLDVSHCIGVANGTDAIFIVLKALGVEVGDEVILPANTFIATAEAISSAGATPVFVDCDPHTYNIDPSGIRQAITPRTKAIVPVHLYGQPADMATISSIAEENGLYVIEDAAQAHGALFRGRRVGSLGDCACFSFYPGKNLGAYGDAGAVVTNDERLAKRVRMFANHGRQDKYLHEREGVNSRLDSIQAAVLSVKLAHLDAWTERRREISAAYDEAFEGTLATPKSAPDCRHVYHLYVVRSAQRDQLAQKLKQNGIHTGVHYPVALPFQPAYAERNFKPEQFPVSHSQMTEILSLPIHGHMKEWEVEYVIENVLRAEG